MVVPIPTLPPNVAKPEDLNVVVVALVATRLLIQAVSEIVEYVQEALVIVPLVANNLVVVELVTVSSETFPKVPQKVGRVA